MTLELITESDVSQPRDEVAQRIRAHLGQAVAGFVAAGRDLAAAKETLPHGEFRSEQTPVLDAMRSFGSEVRWALAQVVTFIANLLPWLIVLVPGLIAIRWFWRRTGRWLARRERPVA